MASKPVEPVVLGHTAQPITGSAKVKAPKPSAKAHGGGNKLSRKAALALIAKHNQAAAGSQQVAPGLTQGQLNRDTAAATGLKYGPAEQALGKQFTQNANQGARTADWYGQYQQAIAQAEQQQQAQNQAAVAGVAQLQQGLDQSAKQAWAGQQATMSADAANRGATVDPQLADVAHNASNVRNALTGSYGAMLLSQGAAGQTGLNNRKVTAGQQGSEALKLNAAARADLGSQRTALAKEKGQFKVQFQQQEKASAADTALKNVLTQAQAQQYGANAAQSLASANASNATAGKTRAETAFVQKYGYVPGKQPSSLDEAKLAYFNKHGYFPPTGPPKSGKAGTASGKDAYGNTGTQRASRQSEYRKIQIDARQFAETAAQKVPGWDVLSNSARAAKLYQAIAPDYGTVDIDIIKGAIQKALRGHVGPHVKKSLTRQGVKAR